MSSVLNSSFVGRDEALVDELARVREVSFKRFCELDATARQALEEYRLASQAHWKACVEKIRNSSTASEGLSLTCEEEAVVTVSLDEIDRVEERGSVTERPREVVKPDYNISSRVLSKKEAESFTSS